MGAPARDAPLPPRIGGFRMLARLGGGGMGVVFVAEQEGLGREVALEPRAAGPALLPGARERFRREVEAIARLQHPGIVPVYAEGGEDNGIPYYAMERVRGASLEEVLVALAGRDPARLTGAQMRRAVEELSAREPAPLDAATAARPGGAGAGGAAGGGAAGGDAAPGRAAPTDTTPSRATPGRAASERAATGRSTPGRGTLGGTGADALFAGTWTSACLRIARAVAPRPRAPDHADRRRVAGEPALPGVPGGRQGRPPGRCGLRGGDYDAPPERGLRAVGRVYAGWGLSQAFYRQGLFRQMGSDTLDAFLVDFWEAFFVALDANDLLSQLDTWQRADLSATDGYGGDLRPCAGRHPRQGGARARREGSLFPAGGHGVGGRADARRRARGDPRRLGALLGLGGRSRLQ